MTSKKPTNKTQKKTLTKKGKWGGYREGSGRPTTGRITERSFTTRAEDIEKLHQIKAITGENLRDIFARLVQGELERVEGTS